MSITTLFFDLDDTLYPARSGLWNAIRDRMNQYLIEKLGFPPEKALALRHFYYETYGTTLRGLQKHYHVNADEYLAYVHDLPLSAYIQPDAELSPMLKSLDGDKWIFTNADARHTRRVLALLGVEDCFSGIIDVGAMNFACKPEPEAYRRALELAGGPDPHECLMVDDSPRNLAPARDLGFYTVLVSSQAQDLLCHRVISHIHQFPSALPQRWR